MVKILFVCMGNICRSPTAEGVFTHIVEQAGMRDRVEIDSAGTHAYHVGESPDARSAQAAARRGIDLSGLQARKVRAEDFAEFDYILAMDRANFANLQAICPPEHRHKLKMFMDYADQLREQEVPDPYYGGGNGFEYVLDLVEAASEGLLREIQS